MCIMICKDVSNRSNVKSYEYMSCTKFVTHSHFPIYKSKYKNWYIFNTVTIVNVGVYFVKVLTEII